MINEFKQRIKEEIGSKDNIGIEDISALYIETNKIQDKSKEYIKILEFVEEYIKRYSEKNNIPIKDLDVQFINYGKTELVYVLTEKSGKRVTLLVKQPSVEFGSIAREAKYLIELQERDKNVVAPIDYFKRGYQELYVTPYINQARCIASQDKWGMYIPEPSYRFEPFTEEQERIVNQCMIAKLVSLYDQKKLEGIRSCKLGGGDFMLPKGWEKQVPTIENTLDSMYLIAARNRIICTFNEYLDLIRDEFSRTTINENQKDLSINLRGRVPMKKEDIEAGIELGKLIASGEKPINRQTQNNNIKDDDMEK